jgi:hypothetical protein
VGQDISKYMHTNYDNDLLCTDEPIVKKSHTYIYTHSATLSLNVIGRNTEASIMHIIYLWTFFSICIPELDMKFMPSDKLIEPDIIY